MPISFTSWHCFEKCIDKKDFSCPIEKRNNVDGGILMSTAHVKLLYLHINGGPEAGSYRYQNMIITNY